MPATADLHLLYGRRAYADVIGPVERDALKALHDQGPGVDPTGALAERGLAQPSLDGGMVRITPRGQQALREGVVHPYAHVVDALTPPQRQALRDVADEPDAAEGTRTLAQVEAEDVVRLQPAGRTDTLKALARRGLAKPRLRGGERPDYSDVVLTHNGERARAALLHEDAYAAHHAAQPEVA